MSTVHRVGPQMRTTLHFTLRLASGEEVDSTQGKRPATFVFGDGNLLPGFERALLGLKAGDRRAVVIDVKSGFGERNAENVRVMARSQFSTDIPLERGLMVSFADKQGELPGVVTAVGVDEVTVDFNHPLAGRELSFEVEIIAVEPDVTEAVVALRDAMATRADEPGAGA